MLLCVDIGNTQIALGLYADDSDDDDPRPPLVRDWRMRTDPRMTADELEVADRRRCCGGHAAHRSPASPRCRRCRACCASCESCCSSDAPSPLIVVGPGRAHGGAAARGQSA